MTDNNNNNSPIVHTFKVNFTTFSKANCLDLDPNSTIRVRQDKSVEIIPDNFQSNRTHHPITPKKQINPPTTTVTRVIQTGYILEAKEVNGMVKSFMAFMNFLAGGELIVDFDTKVVSINVSGSGVPTIESIQGVIV